jgi:hypothetical protein
MVFARLTTDPWPWDIFHLSQHIFKEHNIGIWNESWLPPCNICLKQLKFLSINSTRAISRVNCSKITDVSATILVPLIRVCWWHVCWRCLVRISVGSPTILTELCAFPQPIQSNTWRVSRLSHDPFLPNPLQLITDSPPYPTLYNLQNKSVVKYSSTVFLEGIWNNSRYVGLLRIKNNL